MKKTRVIKAEKTTPSRYIDILFVLKPVNKSKLHSHLWLLYGFCRHLNPTYFYTIDCGTVPEETGLCEMYLAMEKDMRIGGCCGEITVGDFSAFNLVLGA